VIAATDSAEVNAAVYRGPSSAAFWPTASTTLPIAISISVRWSAAANCRSPSRRRVKVPAFAQRLRREIDEQLPEISARGSKAWANSAAKFFATHPRGEERRLLLHAAAAAIGCSLSDREWASNVLFSTGHHAQSHNRAPLPALEDVTRVVYMPGRDLRLLAEEWLQEGLPADLPCAVVSRAAQPEQQVLLTTLGALGETESAAAPSLLIAGWAVRERFAPVQTTLGALPAVAD
jgi:hypothetical protein